MLKTLPIPTLVILAAAVTACAAPSAAPSSASPSPAPAAGARTVQPGAPGEDSRVVTESQLDAMGGVAYVQADVDFMQGMIPHHAQALQMTALVPDRTQDRGVRQMALRMEISQRDEIALMARWLGDRGETVPPSAADPLGRTQAHMDHGDMDHGRMGGMPMMPGMLTPEQMAQLAAAAGAEFDRLFLEFMIQHHEGAIVMVDALFSTDGAGQESEIFQFASHVDADQRAEIARMRALLDARR
ncbi:MAG TPA: DUF305 domain-containing protein [Longimicrobiales bacterium]|nr:DUF305 domain-containing protein [Longimicrobiales bacterium]